jgi:hypothetical protein
MDNINKNKKQKSKGSSIILLLAVYSVLLANPIRQPSQFNDGIVMMPPMTVFAQRPAENVVMMPPMTVTAQKPTENVVIMPDIIVTAPKLVSQAEIAMAYDKPAVYVKQTQNTQSSNRLVSLKTLQQFISDVKPLHTPTQVELIKAKVNIKVDRYTKRQGKMIIESGDTVREDIKFSGGTANINGVLDGDFSVMGGNVTLNGLIDGDVSLMGGSMDVIGKIKGDAAILGGDIINKGTINGDVMVAGGNIKLDSGSVVTGDIAIVGGTIEKDTNAVVKGEIKSVNIKILGKTLPKFKELFKFHEVVEPSMTRSASAVVLIIVMAGFFVIALLVALIFPKSIESITQKTQVNVWIPIAIGFGMQILIVPLIVLLAVSLIGIPIIPLFILGLFVCLLLGLTSVLYLVGSRIKHTDDPKQSLIGKFALGFIVIMAIPILGALIRIISPVGGLFSALGFVIIYVAATIGLGAAFYTLVTHRRQ